MPVIPQHPGEAESVRLVVDIIHLASKLQSLSHYEISEIEGPASYNNVLYNRFRLADIAPTRHDTNVATLPPAKSSLLFHYSQPLDRSSTVQYDTSMPTTLTVSRFLSHEQDILHI